MNKSEIRNVIAKSMLADGMSPIIDLEKSHGSWLVDKVSGKEYLDLFFLHLVVLFIFLFLKSLLVTAFSV